MLGHAFGESEGDTHIKWRCHERARGQGQRRRRRNEGLNPKEGNDSFMEMSGGAQGGKTTLATGEEEGDREGGTKLLPCCDDEPNLASRRVGGTAEEGVKWRCRSRSRARLEGYYTYIFGHLFVAMLLPRFKILRYSQYLAKETARRETNQVPSEYTDPTALSASSQSN